MIFAIVGVANAFSCYQEFANSTTGCTACNCNSSGFYQIIGNWSDNNMIDGDYSTESKSNNGTSYVNVTYYKPTLATMGILQAEGRLNLFGEPASNTKNTTVPSSCWDTYNDKLIIKIESNKAGSNWSYSCYNGLNWIILHDATTSNLENYVLEEGMNWIIPANITETKIKHSDNQTAMQRIFNFNSSEDIYGSCNLSNFDNDTTFINYTWYKNNLPFYSNYFIGNNTIDYFSTFLYGDQEGWNMVGGATTTFSGGYYWGKIQRTGNGNGYFNKSFTAINNISFIVDIFHIQNTPTCPVSDLRYPQFIVYLDDTPMWICKDSNCTNGIYNVSFNVTNPNINSNNLKFLVNTAMCKGITNTAYDRIRNITITSKNGNINGTYEVEKINETDTSNGDIWKLSCNSCTKELLCTGLNYSIPIYEYSYTNVSELFETGTQIFDLNFNGTYPNLSQWVMISNPYNFYMTSRDEAGSTINNFTNFLVIAGDNTNNQSYSTSFLFNGSKTGRIDGMRIDQYARLGTPDTQNMIYNISICETNVDLLTANATTYADCNNTPIMVRPNANLSQILDALPNTTYMNFTTPFNMTQGGKYILNIIAVSQSNNSANDFWRIDAEAFAGQTKYRRVINGVASTFDYITNISFYTYGVPVDTNSLAWENMTEGILGQWSITKLIPSVDADTPMTYLYRWNDTITERIIPVNTTIKNFQIGLNGSVSILNVTFYDELNQSNISPNMTTESIWKVTFQTGAVQTFSLNTTGAFTINMTPSTAVVQANIEFKYIKDGYRQRTYYLINATLSGDSITQLRLADIVANDSISSPITFNLKNYNTDILPDYYLDIQRWYVDQNGYSTIALAKADVQAKIVVWLQPYLAFYRMLVYDKEGNIVYTASRQIISQSDIEIQLSQGMAENTFTKFSSMQYTFTKNKTLGTIRADLVDTTGSPFSASMNVDRMGIFGGDTVCNASGSGSATSLICNVPTNTTDEYVISVDVTKAGDTFPLIADSLNYKTATFGSDGVIAGFMIIGTLAFIGLGSPHMAILMTLLGLGLAITLKMIVTGTASFVGLIIVGIAMLMVMRR
jgi:hypothetical protein